MKTKYTLSDEVSEMTVQATTVAEAAQLWVEAFEWPADWTAKTNAVSVAVDGREVATFRHDCSGTVRDIVEP